jgi:hypothetical protein
VQAGAQVAEVVPDESRLERLFLHPGAATSSPAASPPAAPPPTPAPGAGA